MMYDFQFAREVGLETISKTIEGTNIYNLSWIN